MAKVIRIGCAIKSLITSSNVHVNVIDDKGIARAQWCRSVIKRLSITVGKCKWLGIMKDWGNGLRVKLG